MQTPLPFSAACEHNKRPILQVLHRHLAGRTRLLEIGGGTGQHAVFFAERFPALIWQSSDLADNLANLNRRIHRAAFPNLVEAIALDVNDPEWNCGSVDAVFSANSLHIMSVESVRQFFAGTGRHLQVGGLLLVYGPFKYAGAFTTPSNRDFDQWLKERNPVSGIRDFEWLDALARDAGLELLEDNTMPSNNQLLVWSRSDGR